MTQLLLRIVLFSIVSFAGVSGPLWFFIVAATIYIFLYTGVEIIILAAAIDAYFGYQLHTGYVYTIGVALGVFIIQWLKPRLSVYNQ